MVNTARRTKPTISPTETETGHLYPKDSEAVIKSIDTMQNASIPRLSTVAK